jgi:hypothetical protein
MGSGAKRSFASLLATAEYLTDLSFRLKSQVWLERARPVPMKNHSGEIEKAQPLGNVLQKAQRLRRVCYAVTIKSLCLFGKIM